MKKIFARMLAVFFPLASFSQNAVPVISDVRVSFDDAAKLVTVNFNLSDNESDDVEIFVTLSDNWGGTFLAEMTNVQGDAGYPVSPGNDKQVTFNYNDSLQPVPGWMVKVTADDRQPLDIQEMVNQVDSARLLNYLTFMEGIRHQQAGLAHLENVKDFIETNFRQNGLLTYRQSFIHDSFPGYPAANIISWQPGLKAEKKTYIIDAHFDSVNNSPGADDNGSGMAGVLEAARILSQYRFEHTIKFIGFDFEETSFTLDGLLGSRNYVSDGIKSHEEIEGVFNFEMIGYHSNQPNSQQVPAGFNIAYPTQYNIVASDSFRGNFIVNTSNYTSETLGDVFDVAASQYVPALKVISITIPDQLTLQTADFWRSDHASFWRGDYKALMITDGADFRNNNYHTPSDTIGLLNFTFMSNVVKATVAAVATLAKPMHATSEVAYLIDTGVENPNQACFWSSVQSASSIVFYPAADCNNIEWNVSLFDTQGKLVFNAKSFRDDNVTIETSRLPKGLYFFLAENDGKRKSLSVMLK